MTKKMRSAENPSDSPASLADLQESVQDRSAFKRLDDYVAITGEFLGFVQRTIPRPIVSPTTQNYMFYQYGEEYGHKITRPLNRSLFIESVADFKTAFERFIEFLADLKRYEAAAAERKGCKRYIDSKEINKVVYTIQQVIGSVGDSFENPNQCRKRVGDLFEMLVKLIIQEVGVDCESRTIKLPIPGFPGYNMTYQLDLVFSRDKAIIASETKFIHPSEVVGSVKITSKDRIDKLFLDKYLLNKLLGRDIPVIAVFLHDVQRAVKGDSIFGVNSTFKSNHFLGYTVAMQKLNGVYYVDPRPKMAVHERLREQIRDFQQFLVKDLWILSSAKSKPDRQ
ncbi:MAG: hypothetical protein BWX84_00160 [Verrucomicrobia bacterium ADurb.Bin118]|nr:MAG: hypothetical protein BWX84_00160 [Verrucomicrobia bacterium ADurb.Bin118]